MKKSFFALTIALAGTMFITSCNKHHEGTHSTQTINATTEMNKAYQFDLGTVAKNEAAKITEQAQHYTLSEVGDNNNYLADSPQESVYRYMPAMNYTGADQVSITVADGNHCCAHHSQNCGHNDCHQGDCDHNTTTYIIKINVTRATAAANPTIRTNNAN